MTAKQGARLYFAVQDLKLLDDMYQFSMSWFQKLFNSAFNVEEEASDEEEKSKNDDSESNAGAPKRRRAASRLPNGDLTKKQKLAEM